MPKFILGISFLHQLTNRCTRRSRKLLNEYVAPKASSDLSYYNFSYNYSFVEDASCYVRARARVRVLHVFSKMHCSDHKLIVTSLRG